MHDVVLAGCRPEPILDYLKALGILRLVGEQVDPEARAAWRQDVFVLQSKLDASGLETFFQQDYCPTPIVSPWAGGSGFFDRDRQDYVEHILDSQTPQLEAYRQVIGQVRAILKQAGLDKKPSNQAGEKEALLRLYRRHLPDTFVQWLDCVMVLQSEAIRWSPLLGTGGNDGRLEFSQNFMHRLLLVGMAENQLRDESTSWLRNALWGLATSKLEEGSAGQYDPGRLGSPTSLKGGYGESRVNPWSFILMLEGTLLLAGSVARQFSADQAPRACFPFCCDMDAVGSMSLGEIDADRDHNRGEIWLPLWAGFTTLREAQHVFSEGRAQVGPRQARHPVDFARAIVGGGTAPGLSAFVRYGFLRRNGKAFLAVPLARFEVRPLRWQIDLLGEVDSWLSRFQTACRSEGTPPRFATARRVLEAAIMAYCQYGETPRLGQVLRALGQCECELARVSGNPGQVLPNPTAKRLAPVPLLSPDWLVTAQEDSPEFRIALALASMCGNREVGSLRTNLEPLVERRGRWLSWSDIGEARWVAWRQTALATNLTAILEKRLTAAQRAGLAFAPLDAAFPAHLSDVTAFLSGQTDDQRIADWLWGLILIDLHSATGDPRLIELTPVETELVPRAYALLKLCFLPAAGALRNDQGIRSELAVLNFLGTSQLDRACQVATGRLRASGYMVMSGQPSSHGPDYWMSAQTVRRLAAALLIPVGEYSRLRGMVLRSRGR